MFKKLRNKFVVMNFGITSAVIILAFSIIYFTATNFANNRESIPHDAPEYTVDIKTIIKESIQKEKDKAAEDLLLTLVLTGIAIEVAVVVISYLYAEQSIKPIREAYETQKIFIANASHEIKTPLAAISANLEAADIKNNKWIKNVEIETAKLTALNTELLTLARTDLVSTTTAEETDLTKITKESVKSFEPRLDKIKLTAKYNLTEKIKINVADYNQLISILLDNAIKYCDKKITVELSNHTLKVSNDGTTIQPENLAHLFDRFYQVDKNAEGVGLGLSIAQSLADRNNWRLAANSNQTTTSFTLKF